jgi:4'-phosphopantetheinyl transferase
VDPSEPELHVWLIPGDCAPAVAHLIDGREREQADRFVFAHSARLFIAAHGAMRMILGRYLGHDPTTLVFSTTADGKPYLEDHPGLAFNLAHSGHLAAVAVAAGRPVGVDIEEHRHLAGRDRLAQRIMTPSELSDYLALDEQSRLPRFFSVWARKEALLKAEGTGIRVELRSYPSDRDDAAWRVVDFEVPGYAAAAASSGGCWSPRVRWYR